MGNFWKRLNKFWIIISSFKWKVIILFIVMIFAALSETVGLSLIVPGLNVIIEGNLNEGIGKYLRPLLLLFPREKALFAVIGLFLFLFITKSFLQILLSYLFHSFSWKLSERWYNGIMEHYLFGPYSFILNHKQGVLLNNLITEPSSAAQSIIRVLQLLSKLIISVFLYGLLWLTNWQVTAILSVVALFILLMTQGISRRYSESAGRRKISLLQKQNAVAAENIIAMRLVKTFSLESICLKQFGQINMILRKLRVRFGILKDLPNPLGELLVVFGIVGMLIWFNLYYQGDAKEMLPLVGMVVLVSHRLLNNMSFLVTQQMNINFLLPSLSLVHGLAIGRNNNESLDVGEVFSELCDDIVLQNISFSYDSESMKPVFDSLTLHIPKDKMTAFIGPSGVGKSTLADLLLGLISPTQGEIIINGKPLEKYSVNAWRKRLGFVSQDTIIFNTNIRDNIRLGKPDASEDEVFKAAKMAAIHDFVLSLPEGYNTGVGDRGLRLSGGQRQRIAIARAIVRDPEIFIFDEATSALDHETERSIQRSIEELGRSKTVIVIAHRLSTIKNADVVYNLGEMTASSKANEA